MLPSELSSHLCDPVCRCLVTPAGFKTQCDCNASSSICCLAREALLGRHGSSRVPLSGVGIGVVAVLT